LPGKYHEKKVSPRGREITRHAQVQLEVLITFQDVSGEVSRSEVLEENLPGENLASKPRRNKTQIDGSAKAETHQASAPQMF
jgi:hypothetical protein